MLENTPLQLRSGLASIGIARILSRWNPRNDPQSIWSLPGVLKGHRMRFRCPEDFQMLDKQYEPGVCKAIVSLVKNGWVCADVGAHIGYFTLLMAKIVGAEGRVIAFEALPENAAYVVQNVEINGYQQRVVVENVAVSNGLEKTVTLYAGSSSFESSILYRGIENAQIIPAKGLDDYFSSGKSLDFVKMDIEGAEVKAVEGMSKLLSTVRPIILLEVHDVGWPAVDNLIAAGYLLFDLGFMQIDLKKQYGKINHCIAVPNEKRLCIESA